MKNINVFIGIVIIVAIGYFAFRGNGSVREDPVVMNTPDPITFVTGDQEFSITYSENADRAMVEYSGMEYELEVARAASGARYVSADGSVVFWEHQGEAMLEIEGVMVVEGATVKGGYKDATYQINGESVQLINGYSESEVVPGSATKIVTRYFGNELVTDLDGDGDDDVAFILTQETGGSGVFYYAVAARNTDEGYVGSDGYLLGDRIAPQSVEVSSHPRHVNVVMFNYADRSRDESMSTPPSIGKSVYLKLVPEDMQWAIVEPDFEGESAL